MTNRLHSPPLLEVSKVSKRFPGVVALDEVDLRLARGEVLAVIGENGAGKSTLMKILAGVLSADSGSLAIEGRPVRFHSVASAQSSGVALIHQELNLCDNLSIGANIFLGREPRWFAVIDEATIERRSREILYSIGLRADPRWVAGRLSIGQQQMVEIAKALSVDAKILIMDEPTSSLTQAESESLFRTIDQLRQRGVSVIYISHRLGEVERVADRVEVLRDGRNAGMLRQDQISHDAMVRLMVGRNLSQFYQRGTRKPGEAVLKVDQLRTAAHPQHALSFSVRSAEIVGLAGLVGAGRSELFWALFGVQPAVGGQIEVNGRRVRLSNPWRAIDAGLALVPEDRKSAGLLLEMAVRENISLPGLRRTARHLAWIDFARERDQCVKMIRRMAIKTPGIEQQVQYLSGGNQQKIVLSKWLLLAPKLLLLDEPTRGVDVGAKQEIYRLMDELAAQGVAILFVSSEMEEMLGMSDRMLVMHQGKMTGELTGAQMTEQNVMRLATGGEAEAADLAP